MTIRKLRPEDNIEEADRLDRAAALASTTPEEVRSLRALADLFRTPVSSWPVEDAPRTFKGDFSLPLDELGDLHAYDPRTDSYVLLPVRVGVHDDLGMQIGPYDLGRMDISVLRRAIASHDALHAQGHPRQVR